MFILILLGVQEVLHIKQYQFIIISPPLLASNRERVVVVVGDHDGALIDAIDVLNGHKGKVKGAVACATRRNAVGILNIHQVDIGDFLKHTLLVRTLKVDEIDAFELGRVVCPRFSRVALAAITLDD